MQKRAWRELDGPQPSKEIVGREGKEERGSEGVGDTVRDRK